MRQNRLGRSHPGIEQTVTAAPLPDEMATTKSDTGAGVSVVSRPYAGIGGAVSLGA
jgi:hypothetical protein